MTSQPFTIIPPTHETLPSFSRLTRTLLPINYSPNFFEASLHPPTLANTYSLARIAIWTPNDTPDSTANAQTQPQPQVVGGIYGRIQPNPLAEIQYGHPPECQLYIATLAVLAPWRGKGIASALLRGLVSAAVGAIQDQMDSWTMGPLTSVCAHVWEVNDDALAWYLARGFESGEVIEGYYRKLRPDGARLVRRGVVGLLIDELGNGKDGERVEREEGVVKA